MGLLFGLFPGLAPFRLLIEIAVALALAAAVAFYIHHVREEGVAQGRAEVQVQWDAAMKRQQAEAIAQAAKNAQETQRRLAAQQEAQRVHDEELARARADADRAGAAARGLRQQLARVAAAARRAASDPAPAGDSQAAPAALDLLSYMLGESLDRATGLAAALDESHAAGLQCERAYQSLTVKP